MVYRCIDLLPKRQFVTKWRGQTTVFDEEGVWSFPWMGKYIRG